ncbi:UDP-glucose--hexose-1-phosphate uridylyltransferase [Bacillus sp. UMB0893]|uniref:UDP-glucose--hexose-1-phosphate uridylyltransferase n=1 Tax=Bacillus sp. UMB0893 TaxID=2066053 RepID=UPI000C75D316|nr:UDP-glucose--hexose-1-phosphate uridylyltransferase [Bacillus sp. UMB0893]PLR65836.1 UDP-glucose--hexose-1-phosphate uridylyltransferase [Bacillus sp. UMB0893]
MNNSSCVNQLVEQAIQKKFITDRDRIYARNQILGLLGIDAYEESDLQESLLPIPELLESLVEQASERGVIEGTFDEKEKLSANLMNVFLEKPSGVQKTFEEYYQLSPEIATDYFYKLSQNSNYIQTKRISKNIHYKTATEYGEIDITINLSKPEKDPRDIAREQAVKAAAKYPKCLLCIENEGYMGRIGHPARANHRIIELTLENEPWYFQYSPYIYYNEHSIVLSGQHRDMKIDGNAFRRLLAFVEQFPHYFIGSNADLPIVGGSILSHDHYQAGKYTFAMAEAPDEEHFTVARFPKVAFSKVKWPMSVLRLRSSDKAALVSAGEHVLNKWKTYSNEEAEILAFTGDDPHQTVTPIARMRDSRFELDLVLRNNRTSAEHPMGIFHPHADLHHIKKENIGLIEVMGLAVLPERLKTELQEIEAFLLGEDVEIGSHHQEWVQHLISKYHSFEKDTVNEILKKETGLKFSRVLEDAGVFKRTIEGNKHFNHFIQSLKRERNDENENPSRNDPEASAAKH